MFDIVELGLSYVSRIDRSIYMQGERACDLASPDNSDRTSYAHVRKTHVLPFTIPFEKPVLRVFCFITRRQIHCPTKYATPEELYLSFNLVSLQVCA